MDWRGIAQATERKKDRTKNEASDGLLCHQNEFACVATMFLLHWCHVDHYADQLEMT